MSGLNEERQHPATPARLKRAREEGDVAHSNELAMAIQLVAGVGALWFCAATIGTGLRRTTIGLWTTSSISATPDSIVQSSQSLIWTTVRLVLPFMISVFVIGTLAHLVQTKFLLKRPEISITNLSPGRWFRNIFSMSGFGQMIISAPKALVAISVGVMAVWFNQDAIFMLGGMPTNLLAGSLLKITSTIGISVAVSLLVCSVLDYCIQWYSFQNRTRMTDQEMREEIRGQTGDPQIARIRHQRMREMTTRERS